jgi:carbon monoxide dehydrogenase subunit G
MAIEINEQFVVEAPIDTVWAFVVEPARVVTCMPGAELLEQVDDATYLGKVKVKLGAITTAYKGEVKFASVDESGHAIQLVGEGRETGGGTAKGKVDIVLETVETGTQMRIDVTVDLTGKVMQMGRGMIKGVSAQLFKQFATNMQGQLDPGEGERSVPATQQDEALAVVPLLAKTLWQAIVSFFRRLFNRLFGRKSS